MIDHLSAVVARNKKKAEAEGRSFPEPSHKPYAFPRPKVMNRHEVLRRQTATLKAENSELREANLKLEESLSFLSTEMDKLEQENKRLKAKQKKKTTK